MVEEKEIVPQTYKPKRSRFEQAVTTQDKLGLVLISYAYRPERWDWIKQSLSTLAKTNVSDRTYLQLTYKQTEFPYSDYFDALRSKFELIVLQDPAHVIGLDPVFIWSANKMLDDHVDMSHVVFLTDDLLYNPEWLNQLRGLMKRHPDARAWATYRSAYTRHHRTLKVEGDDISVTSISGIGALSRKEWREYAPDWRRGHGGFSVPNTAGGGNTVDLHHAWERPGERWVTARSYTQHIGMVGTHGNANCETAIDFAGID